MPHPDRRPVAVVVHDVAPATWSECSLLLDMIDALGVAPITLLVVPDWHRTTPLRVAHRFADALGRRLAHGDELALHGCFHLDDAPRPRNPKSYFERRVLTRAEGEFAAIDAEAATWRIAHGLAVFDAHGWPVCGFVPPAWLLGPGARVALDRFANRFSYVSVRAGLHHLPEWTFTPTANLCYSPDSLLRRAGSRLMIARELQRARSAALLRISLHPQDTRVPGVLRHWRSLIESAVEEREPMTKRDWVMQRLRRAA